MCCSLVRVIPQDYNNNHRQQRAIEGNAHSTHIAFEWAQFRIYRKHNTQHLYAKRDQSIMFTHIINAFMPISSPLSHVYAANVCVCAIHHPSSKRPQRGTTANTRRLSFQVFYSHVWFSTIEYSVLFLLALAVRPVWFAPLLVYLHFCRNIFSAFRFCLFIS